MSEINSPAVGITEEIIEKAARAYAKLEGNDYDAVSPGNRMAFYGAAGAVLEAALAGRTVVQLPEPDGWVERPDEPRWDRFGVEVRGGQVWDGTRHLRPQAARNYASDLIAAADVADRLASGSSENGDPSWTGQVTT